MIKLRGSKKSGYILSILNWQDALVGGPYQIPITWSELKAIARITRRRIDKIETNKIFKEMLGDKKL